LKSEEYRTKIITNIIIFDPMKRSNIYLAIQWLIFLPIILPLCVLFGALQGIVQSVEQVFNQIWNDVAVTEVSPE
jgi:hypothetical protein